MEKIWYIIDGEHHFGPYEAKEIETLREQNKIRPSGQVISREELRNRLNGVTTQTIRIIAEPPAPKRNFQSKRLPSFDLTHPPKINVTKSIKKKRHLPRLRRFSWPWLNAFLCFMMGVYAWQNVSFMRPTTVLKKPKSMEQREYLQALSTIRAPLNNWKFSLIQSKDFKTAWMASNYPGTLDIILTLQSKDRQVMSKEIISAYAEIIVDNGLGPIPMDQWTFVAGDKLAPGKYQVTIQIKEQNSSWEQKWVTRSLPAQNTITFETTIGTYSDKKLTAELEKFWSAPLPPKAEPKQGPPSPIKNFKQVKKVETVKAAIPTIKSESITELQEQFRLVVSIISQIRSWSMEVAFLNKQELDEKMQLWQQVYQKQFGALFTGLALDNASKENEHKGYRTISNITQKVGARSMDFFADAKQWKKAKNSKANEKFAKDLQKLINQAEVQINELEAQKTQFTE